MPPLGNPQPVSVVQRSDTGCPAHPEALPNLFGRPSAAGSFVREFNAAPGPDPDPPASRCAGIRSVPSGHPVVAKATRGKRIGGGPVHYAARSRMPNDSPPAPHHATARHILSRIAHSAKCRTRRARPRTRRLIRPLPATHTGTGFTIETGSDFQIGPTIPQTVSECPRN